LVRVVGYKVDKNINLRLGEETKGLQVEYYQMGRMRVDKKISGAPGCSPRLGRLRTTCVGPCGISNE
jgi:hypothetical protein